MSYDFHLTINTGGITDAYIETDDYNYTYNVYDMLKEAGIIFKELNGRKVTEVIPVLMKGMLELQRDPSRFMAMEPANGWGSYETLLPFLIKMCDEFEKHPDATFVVS